MKKEGWGHTYDEGTIINIDRDHKSMNGNFTIITLRDDVTRDIKRIQVWDQAYKDIKNEVYFVGSKVIVPGYVSFYTDKNGFKSVALKTENIFPVGGRINIRLQVTSTKYKGTKPEGYGPDIEAFSGKPVLESDRVTESLVVRCYLPRTSVLCRYVDKIGAIVDVDGSYHIEKDETGTRIIIDKVYDIKEVRECLV